MCIRDEKGAPSARADGLSAEEAKAVRLVALGFRAGVALRSVLDTAEEAHGVAGWRSAAAQRALLAATLEYVPHSRGASTTSLDFGARREARFARLLLDEVERAGGSPDVALVERAVRGARTSPRSDARFVRLVLATAPDEEFVLRAAPRSGEVGLRLWEAGIVMYLCVRRGALVTADVAGRDVLEIGAGLGLCAHAYRAAGARSAVLTDGSGPVLDALRANIRAAAAALPDSHCDMRVERLDVGNAAGAARIVAQRGIDTILCSDLTYDPALAVSVARAMEEAITQVGLQKVVGYIFATRRTESSDSILRDALNRTSLNVEEVPVSIDSIALKESSFGVLVQCNKSWDLTKVRIFRLS